MTRKQIRKLANEIAELEIIHRDSESKEERNRAENRIIQLTNQIALLPDGFDIMNQVDEIIYNKLKGDN